MGSSGINRVNGGDLPARVVDSSEKTNMSSESDYPPNGLADSVKKLPEWIQKGCGNDEYVCEEKGATFLGGNMPAECPDLSKHNSFFSENMTPELYNKLKDKKTKLGVTLGHCIKTGVDNPGHPMIKTCGIVAGDEESYELFKELFDPIISSRHGGYAPDAKHPTDLDVNKLSDTKIDPTGKYVLTSRCRTGRSVRGFRLPPTCSFEERREIEKVVVNGLLSLDGELKGDYFPLHGSRSYAPKPNGMTLEKEEELRSAGNPFQEPDSTLLLSGGMGRHWPDARGIFHNNDKNLFVWVNEEDQMRIVSMERVMKSNESSHDSLLEHLKSKKFLKNKVMTSCITTILVGFCLAHPTWELVSVPVAWSKSHCSLPVQISEKSPAKWDSNAGVPLVLILPLLVALGTSQMPTELVNPKSSWSTSSLKVSPKSSAGNKNWKPEKISKTKSPTPVFQPNTKKMEILQI